MDECLARDIAVTCYKWYCSRYVNALPLYLRLGEIFDRSYVDDANTLRWIVKHLPSWLIPHKLMILSKLDEFFDIIRYGKNYVIEDFPHHSKGGSKLNNSNVLLSEWFQCFSVLVTYQWNDNNCLLAERFLYFTGIVLQVNCCYRFVYLAW